MRVLFDIIASITILFTIYSTYILFKDIESISSAILNLFGVVFFSVIAFVNYKIGRHFEKKEDEE